MPYYPKSQRRSRRRSYGRRRSYKRKQSRKRSNNQGTFQYKLRKVYSISSDSFGIITSTLQPSTVTGTTEWGSLQTLFDNFKVNAIKKELRPYSVGNESSTAGATVRGNLVSLVDMDGSGVPADVASAVQYNSCKFLSARSAQSRYLKVPRKYQTQLSDVATGYDPDNKNATIMFRGDGFGASQLQYWVVDTYYVTFTGRR